jgi:hypothetical protein
VRNSAVHQTCALDELLSDRQLAQGVSNNSMEPSEPVQYCGSCGAASSTASGQCPHCGGVLQASPPWNDEITAAGVEHELQRGAGDALPGTVIPASAPPVDERFLNEFSWGPGCNWYYFSRAMVLFLLVQLAFGLSVSVLEDLAEIVLARELPPVVRVLYSLGNTGLGLLLLLWSGSVARRRRWTLLRWADFEEFRVNEGAWRTFGQIGWALFLISSLAGLVEAVIDFGGS